MCVRVGVERMLGTYGYVSSIKSIRCKWVLKISLSTKGFDQKQATVGP